MNFSYYVDWHLLDYFLIDCLLSVYLLPCTQSKNLQHRIAQDMILFINEDFASLFYLKSL